MLVSTWAASLNPVDYKIREVLKVVQRYKLPAVIWATISAGVVEALGDGVTRASRSATASSPGRG